MIGLITARKGSKRLPGKNMMLLGGKPLIQWTIEAALESKLDVVAVSTDSGEIIDLCHDFGVGVRLRPLELCQDDTPHWAVVEYHFFDSNVILLQPTSPFRTSEDINNAIKISEEKHGSVVSITDWGMNGAIYLIRYGLSIPYTYYMPPERSIDIDTIEDFQKAEEMVGAL